ncbi:MAG: DUF1104 domain-containing protein [Sulfurospirillaceae bacterium]|nr:DUF1104 domain-containing protein [Sulfurospirillaceae bacterium]MDD2825406.1 DUF1104 domain-containing protein [Sulfurospirillaceae bacterium]
MLKKILISLILCSCLFAEAKYSDMSTEELLALIGYVKSDNETQLALELAKRVNQMDDNEKQVYNQFKEDLEHAQK